MGNLKLINYVIRKRFTWYLERAFILDKQDLFQVGVLGFKKAMEYYEPEKGAISTYAYHWIFQSVYRVIEEQGFRTMRIPSHATQKLRTLRKEFGDQNIWDLFLNKKINYGEYRTLSNAFNAHNGSSLEAPMFVGADRVKTCLLDFIASESCENFYESLDGEFMRERTEAIISELPDKQREIIEKRFGLNGEEPKTLQEIADLRGCSKEYIRQVEEKAFMKLQHPSRKRRFEELIKN